ncbi:12739_t:CDS:2 [Dentiscutata erythropus]|uniref:12739_t:CDS:1 n=1 Tax=Dentiscutata erythropus TaxID=1348616 RepID=A0A9N9B9S4_9GLOM|nr:12739_t:CDS:2 [Dentiscutata erythropus]
MPETISVTNPNNPQIKVTMSQDVSTHSLEYPIGSTQTVKWDSSNLSEDPEISIQVYKLFPTIPEPTYLDVWPSPMTSKLSQKPTTFLIDPNLFSPGEWYVVRVSLVADDKVSGISDPFSVK